MARCLLDNEIYQFPKTACCSSTAEEINHEGEVKCCATYNTHSTLPLAIGAAAALRVRSHSVNNLSEIHQCSSEPSSTEENS